MDVGDTCPRTLTSRFTGQGWAVSIIDTTSCFPSPSPFGPRQLEQETLRLTGDPCLGLEQSRAACTSPLCPSAPSRPRWAAPALLREPVPAAGWGWTWRAAAQPPVLPPKVRLPGGGSCPPAQTARQPRRSLDHAPCRHLALSSFQGLHRPGRMEGGAGRGGARGWGSRPAAGLPGAGHTPGTLAPGSRRQLFYFRPVARRLGNSPAMGTHGDPERRGLVWWPRGALPGPHGPPSSAG